MTTMISSIQTHIQVILDDLRSNKFIVVYIGIFGSYNYGLADENSDYDFKAIVIPNIDSERQFVDTLLFKYDFGECYAMTFYHFINHILSFDIPCLEIIFSQYNYVDPRFPLRNIRREIQDMLIHNRGKLACNFDHLMTKVYDKFVGNRWYVPKKAYLIIRMYYLFKTFNDKKDYAKALTVPNNMLEPIRRVKLNSIDQQESQMLCESYLKRIRYFVQTSYTQNESLIDQTIKHLYVVYREILLDQLTQDHNIRKNNYITEVKAHNDETPTVSDYEEDETPTMNDCKEEDEMSAIEVESQLQTSPVIKVEPQQYWIIVAKTLIVFILMLNMLV